MSGTLRSALGSVYPLNIQDGAKRRHAQLKSKSMQGDWRAEGNSLSKLLWKVSHMQVPVVQGIQVLGVRIEWCLACPG